MASLSTWTLNVLEPNGRPAPLSHSIVVFKSSEAVGNQVLAPGDSRLLQPHDVLTRLVRDICSRQPNENILRLKYPNSTHWSSYFLIRSVSSTISQYWVAASDNARVDMILNSSRFLFNCSRTAKANWETCFWADVTGHKCEISQYQPAYIGRNISQFIHSTSFITPQPNFSFRSIKRVPSKLE